MVSTEHAGTALFLKRWLRRPFAMGAVVPSGPLLARAMAETRPCLAWKAAWATSSNWAPAPARSPRHCSLPASRRTGLALIERDPELAGFLRQNFPGPQIIEGDAAHLPGLLIANGVERIAAVVSSLPLLSLPSDVVSNIVSGVFETLPTGAAMIQFTYGPKAPVPFAQRDRLHLQGAGSQASITPRQECWRASSGIGALRAHQVTSAKQL